MKFHLIGDVFTADRKTIENAAEANLQITLNAIRESQKYLRHVPDAARIKKLSDIPSLPFMTPAFVSQHSPPNDFSLVCNSRDSGVVLATGGTAGEKKTFYHSWDSFYAVMRIGARSINGAGIDFPKKIANCFLPGSLWGGYLFGQGVVETIRGQLFALGRPQLDELYRTIEAHEINILFCSPSYAAMIFTEDEITKRALRTIRCFYYVGEPVSDSLAKLLAEHYPEVSVKSLAYTTNETGPIGFQCRHQTGGYHHINEDCVFIEIVDPETGRPLESEEGEIVVTTIANDGMPVLRYRLGDKGRFIHESCPCGTRFKTLLLNGRVGNSLNICGMLVSDKSFLNLIEGAKTEDMQVRIYKDQGKTSVSLLVAHDMLADVDVAALHEKARKDSVLKGVLGEAQFGKLTIEPVTRDQFRVSERTGKKLFFVRED